jgi:hypothetical protein
VAPRRGRDLQREVHGVMRSPGFTSRSGR